MTRAVPHRDPKRPQEPQRPNERGVILLTVMLIVAVMAALSVAIVDDIRFGLRRTTNMALYDQAFWYGVGLEEFAKLAAARSYEFNAEVSTLSDPWAQEAVRFPIPGGLIEGSLADGGACFNLNSLVDPSAEGQASQDADAVQQFSALLRALDVPQADHMGIINAITDWIDVDNTPLPRGAEDYAYTNLQPPYRTGDARLADVSELRAIQGVGEVLYRTLRPFVCALPNNAPNAINVNTLEPRDAPLLQMLLGARIDRAAAEAIIFDRPDEGFRTVEEFWNLKALETARPPLEARPIIETRTQYFDLTARVLYEEAYFQLRSSFYLDTGGRISLVSRTFGADE